MVVSMIKKITFLILILVFTSNLLAYSMGNRQVKEKSVNLVEKFNLYNIDKIKIKGEDFLEETKGISVLIEGDLKLKEVMDELNNVQASFLCDTWVNFKIFFYRKDKLLLELGYNNNLSHPFVRYKNEAEFVINKILRLKLIEIVNKK